MENLEERRRRGSTRDEFWRCCFCEDQVKLHFSKTEIPSAFQFHAGQSTSVLITERVNEFCGRTEEREREKESEREREGGRVVAKSFDTESGGWNRNFVEGAGFDTIRVARCHKILDGGTLLHRYLERIVLPLGWTIRTPSTNDRGHGSLSNNASQWLGCNFHRGKSSVAREFEPSGNRFRWDCFPIIFCFYLTASTVVCN